MQKGKIGFYNIPLSTPIKEVQEGLTDDENLLDAILLHSEELATQDIETWVHEKNMIVTEVGYRLALYMDEKEQMTDLDKYIESCEKTIQHLITLIYSRSLQKHFSPDVLKEAIDIRNTYAMKKRESK